MQKPCNIGPKVAKPLQPDEPCQLAKYVKEIRRCMRLLTTFMEEKVLSKDPPSPWVMVMVEEEALESTRERAASAREPTLRVPFQPFPSWDAPSTSSIQQQWQPPPQLFLASRPVHKYFHAVGENTSSKSCCIKVDTPAWIHQINKSLCRNDTPHITIDLPLVLATSPGLLVGTAMATMMSIQLWQDTMMGTTYVDTVTASMSLVSLGPPLWWWTAQQPPWRMSQSGSQKTKHGHSHLCLMSSVSMPYFPNNGGCLP